MAGLVDEDVDFTSYAEFGEVDAGFDGEASSGEDAALFVGFEVVHVGAVAVDFFADRVAGAVDEVLAVAGLVDDIAASAIDLPAFERLLLGVRIFDAIDGGVAGGGDDVEDLDVLLRDG